MLSPNTFHAFTVLINVIHRWLVILIAIIKIELVSKCCWLQHLKRIIHTLNFWNSRKVDVLSLNYSKSQHLWSINMKKKIQWRCTCKILKFDTVMHIQTIVCTCSWILFLDPDKRDANWKPFQAITATIRSE